MTLTILTTFCVLMCGWSFLRVLGNERQRLIQDRESADPSSADASAKPPEPPVGR